MNRDVYKRGVHKEFIIMAPKNKGNTTQVTLRIPLSLKNSCEIAANNNELSLNDWIKKSLEFSLNTENMVCIPKDTLYQVLNEEPRLMEYFGEIVGKVGDVRRMSELENKLQQLTEKIEQVTDEVNDIKSGKLGYVGVISPTHEKIGK